MATMQLDDDIGAQARFNMVECQIKPGGVRDYRLTLHLSRLPREAFVSSELRDLAYADLEIECLAGETSRHLLTPTAFARLAELADVQAEDVVLDIAGGTGYSAAVLAGLASTVIALEAEEALGEKASEIWQQLGIDNAVAVSGALVDGQAKQGPFDVILINGCIAQLPEALLAQLTQGGRLVCVQWVDGASKAHIYRRMGDSFASQAAFDLSAPSLASFDPAPVFEF